MFVLHGTLYIFTEKKLPIVANVNGKYCNRHQISPIAIFTDAHELAI